MPTIAMISGLDARRATPLVAGFALLATSAGCSLVAGLDQRHAPDASAASSGGGGRGGAVVVGGGAGTGGAAGSRAACDVTKPFGPPAEIREVDTAGDEWSVALSADELTIYLNSDRLGHFDLFQATRPTRQDPFGAPTPLDPLNEPSAWTGAMTVTGNGLTAYYHRGLGTYDIYMAKRTSAADAFGAGVPVSSLNSAADEEFPFVIPDGSAVYFSSNWSGGHDIYVAARDGQSGLFGTPSLVVGTTVEEMAPVVTPDELTIFFAMGPDHYEDIWVAHRIARADGFAAPQRVAELNTTASDYPGTIDNDVPGRDFPGWISSDGCRLYFTSNGHARSSGRMDIFVAARPE
jgi:hypothetical protein